MTKVKVISGIPRFGIHRRYENFNRMMECQRQIDNIESIWNFLFNKIHDTNLPDTTSDFLDKVCSRLENEQRKLKDEYRDRYNKELKKKK